MAKVENIVNEEEKIVDMQETVENTTDEQETKKGIKMPKIGLGQALLMVGGVVFIGVAVVGGIALGTAAFKEGSSTESLPETTVPTV